MVENEESSLHTPSQLVLQKEKENPKIFKWEKRFKKKTFKKLSWESQMVTLKVYELLPPFGEFKLWTVTILARNGNTFQSYQKQRGQGENFHRHISYSLSKVRDGFPWRSDNHILMQNISRLTFNNYEIGTFCLRQGYARCCC